MANDYTNDPDAVAVFRFNDDLTDEKGGVTLVNVNTVNYDGSDKKEGSHCLSLTDNDNDCAYCVDANLPSNFPGKYNGVDFAPGTCTYSVSAWSQPLSFPGVGSYNPIAAKYESNSGRVWQVQWGNNTGLPGTADLVISVGYNVGNTVETIRITPPGGGLALDGTWYHVVVTYDAPTRAYTAKIRNAAGTVLLDTSGTSVQTIVSVNGPFCVGCAFIAGSPGASSQMTQKIDDLVIWKRVLSTADGDKLFNGTYGASVAAALVRQPGIIGGGLHV